MRSPVFLSGGDCRRPGWRLHPHPPHGESHSSASLMFLCRGWFFRSVLRVGTFPGAPAAERSAGFPKRSPIRRSRLQSAVWICCWTASATRWASTPSPERPFKRGMLQGWVSGPLQFALNRWTLLCFRSDLSRFSSRCLGLQHRHDPRRPSWLW